MAHLGNGGLYVLFWNSLGFDAFQHCSEGDILVGIVRTAILGDVEDS